MKKNVSIPWTRDIVKDRKFARYFLFYGLKTREDFFDLLKPRTYDALVQEMSIWFEECFKSHVFDGAVDDTDVKKKGKKKIMKYLSLDCTKHPHNPLYNLWKACSFTNNQILFYFSMLDYFITNEGPKKQDDLTSKYWFNGNGKVEDESKDSSDDLSDVYRNKLYGYTGGAKFLRQINDSHCGSIIKLGDGHRAKYQLTSRCDLSPVLDALFFYSEMAPVGVIGSFILDKCEKDRPSVFRFKHHFVGQAFDSEIICNSLSAIRDHKYIWIKYLPTKNSSERTDAVLPLKIYSSTQNGRQYLFAWYSAEKKYRSIRLDYVSDIGILDRIADDYEKISKEFDIIRKNIWGVSRGKGERTYHVKFSVIVADNEGFIVRRLEREKRFGKVYPDSNKRGKYNFEADVFDPREMLPWIRTFICRIDGIEIEDKEVERDFIDSVNELYAYYSHMPVEKTAETLQTEKTDKSEAPVFFQDVRETGVEPKGKKISLFSEFFGFYYTTVYHVLKRVRTNEYSMKELEGIIKEEAEKNGFFSLISETVTKAIRNVFPKQRKKSDDIGLFWPFFVQIEETKAHEVVYRYKSRLNEGIGLTLSPVEARWLKSVISDPRIGLFCDEEIALPVLDDVEPLFDLNDYVLFDQYEDGDPYESTEYRKAFRSILKGIQNNSVLKICHYIRDNYVDNKKQLNAPPKKKVLIAPERIEYSERDDKFRLIGNTESGRYTINISSVIRCETVTDADKAIKCREGGENDNKQVKVTVLLTDERNALERFMVNFTHLEKEADLMKNNQYKISITYDKAEETDLLIKLLSFGKYVKVLEPDSFVCLIKERIEKQKELWGE